MSKHVSGPWAVSYGGDGEIFIDEKTGRGVARVYGGKGGGISEATAHLIAAAPELLKACECLVKVAITAPSGMEHMELLERLGPITEAAEAAVAKAMGQEGQNDG